MKNSSLLPIALFVTVFGVFATGYVALKSVGPELARTSARTQLAAVDPSDPALVGWWKFDEGSGTTAVDSVGGNNATLSNGAAYIAGHVGSNALNLDGMNDYAVTTGNLNISNAFTVAAWIDPNGSQAAYFRILETDYASGFSLNGDSTGAQVQFTIKNGSTATGGTYAPGTWVYVVATFDGSVPRLYMNGSLVGSGAPTSMGAVSMPLYFGTFDRSPGSSSQFKGAIDDVAVYNRALSSAEVQQLYSGVSSGGGGTTGGTTPPADTTPPSIPTGLSATAISSSQINLSWSASSDANGVAGYKIFRDGAQIGTSNSTAYSDTGLAASTAHSYTVSAYDAANNPSNQSSSASATTLASGAQPSTRTLSLYKYEHAGQGIVTATVNGSQVINCGSSCTASVPVGASITLTASPTVGSLSRWEDCPGASGNTCTIAMPDWNMSLGAVFTSGGFTPKSTLAGIIQQAVAQGGLTWVFTGDSFSTLQTYTVYFESYFQLHYPNLLFHFRNMGRGGSQISNLIDDPTNNPHRDPTTGNPVGFSIDGSFDAAVYGLSPDVISVEFTDNGHPSQQQLHDAVKSFIQNYIIPNHSTPVVLGAWPTNNAVDMVAATSYMKTLYDADEQVGQELGIPAGTDWYTMAPMMLANLNSPTPVNLDGLQNNDNTEHLNEAGTLAAASYILADLGADGNVGSATVDASSGTLVSQSSATVTGVAKNAYSGVDFTRKDDRLPMAFDDISRPVLSIDPQVLDMNKYMLTVNNLSAGTYDIYVDGVKSATVDSSTLASGWNMTTMTQGPIHDQLVNVITKIRNKEGASLTRIYDAAQQSDPSNPCVPAGFNWWGDANYGSNSGMYNDPGYRGDYLVSQLASAKTELACLDNRIHASAQPVARTFSIRKSGSTAPSSDTTLPTVQVTAPTGGSAISGTVTITASAQDDIAVAGVQFKIDGVSLGSEDTVSPYSISWDSTTATAGTHAITAIARDTSNNLKTSTSVSVTVNNAQTQQPPPAGSAVSYYVDGINGNDSNPGSLAAPFKTIQKAADIVNPGDTVNIKAGTYKSTCVGNKCGVVTISRSGTAGNMITFKPYGDGPVLLRGWTTYSDADANGDGMADGPADGGVTREWLVNLTGNYIHVTGLDLGYAVGSGMAVDGSFDLVDNVVAHDNWSDGFGVGLNNTGRVEGDTLLNVEAHHNRHNYGIQLGRRTEPGVTTDILNNITVKDSLSYQNGRDANGNEVLPFGGDPQGGGNSDGIVVDKFCYFNLVAPYDNMCQHITLDGDVVWSNNDDGFDLSFAHSLVVNSISFHNGPTASEGFKNFKDVTDNAFVGNISYDNLDTGFQLRTTGLTFLNNTSVGNAQYGTWGVPLSGNVHNNISYANNTSGLISRPELTSGCVSNCLNNWIGGDPRFYSTAPFKDSNGNISVVFPSNLTTIAQKAAWMKDQFKNAFSLQSTSAAIDAGVPASYTNPVTGLGVSVQYYGSAPDMGALEYQVGQVITPPVTQPVVDPTLTVTKSGSGSVTSSPSGISCGSSCSATFTSGTSVTLTAAPTSGYGTTWSGCGATTSGNTCAFTLNSSKSVSASFNLISQGPAAPGILSVSAISITTSGATLVWTTDAAASTQVLYGATSAYGSQTAVNSALSASHSQAISGLSANAVYHYAVVSTNAGGTTQSADQTFTTSSSGTGSPSSSSGGGGGGGGGGGSPTVSPAVWSISEIKVTGSIASGVAVNWKSSSPASSQIVFGLSSSYGLMTAFDPAQVMLHSQDLIGLISNATYHLQVRSKDQYGTLVTSGDVTFAVPSVGQVTAVVQPVSAASANPQSSSNSSYISYGNITSGLIAGTIDPQVKALQQILNASGYPIASSGPGSKGNETSYFGPATEAALQRFQCATLQVCSGSADTTGYGAIGPRTRAALNALAGSGSAANVPIQSVQTAPTNIPAVPSGSITTWLLLGTTNSQVKTLQQILNASGFTVASSGAGSKGSESTHLGPATDAALKRFQCAKLSVCSGAAYTTGYGATGPKTRAALNAMIVR